jgi:hypothetical protein|tara:strand:+ start:1618 stop:3135 length:1518 start_codon:yes stop_codon:yes gene_type:complete
MRLVNLGIVTDNIDPKGIGRVRYKVLGNQSGPSQGAAAFEDWEPLDPFCASPFLPNNLNFIPTVGQTIKIVQYDLENDLMNQEYIPGPFTTIHDWNSQSNSGQLENTSFGVAVKQTGNIFNENGTYVKSNAKNSLAKHEDSAIYGKYGSDVLFTENGVSLRGGKLLSKDSANARERSDLITHPLRGKKQATLSLKKFSSKQEFKEEKEIVVSVPTNKLNYVIEYDLDDVTNPTKVSWYIYYVREVFGDAFATNVFTSSHTPDLTSIESVTLINEDNTTTTPTFVQTVDSKKGAYIKIRKTLCDLHDDGLKIKDIKITTDRSKYIHPFYFRPRQSLVSIINSTPSVSDFLDNIKPSCNTSVSEGSGLFWSISEPSPKPKSEERKITVLKTISSSAEQSFGTLVSDKIYLLSTDANEVGSKTVPFDKLDTYEYTQEDLLTRIEPNTYATVRGETLLAFLDQLYVVMAGHAHQPTKPMVKEAYGDWKKLEVLRNTLKNDILNKSIRIN